MGEDAAAAAAAGAASGAEPPALTAPASGGGGLFERVRSMVPFGLLGGRSSSSASSAAAAAASWRAAEAAILGLVGAPVVVRDVPVGPTPKHTMRTYEVDPPASSSSPPPPPVVLLPGYGAGAGFFFRNLSPLSRLGLPVLAADWLGTGLSGRPPFPLQSTPPDGESTRLAAERFFLDAFDAWCEKEEIGEGRARGKMVLCGHSLGGYLAATYALEKPQHVQHLVLICPAGLPEQPPGWREGLHARVAEASGRFSLRPALVRWAERAWDAGTTHGGILRALGPWGGEQLMRRYAAGRFSSSSSSSSGDASNDDNNKGPERTAALSPEEAGVVGSYLWELTSLEGSGEHALRHILGFGAFAHAPLGKRLEALSVPVTFCYGSRDWMKPEHAVAAAARLDALRKPLAEHDHGVVVLPDCGHFPFLEQPAAFDEAMARILRQYGGGGKGAKEGAAAAAR